VEAQKVIKSAEVAQEVTPLGQQQAAVGSVLRRGGELTQRLRYGTPPLVQLAEGELGESCPPCLRLLAGDRRLPPFRHACHCFPLGFDRPSEAVSLPARKGVDCAEGLP
jgi:hypothetical protein